MEYRIKDVQLECTNDESFKIGGYINVTERESEMLYSKKRNRWFKEVMKRGVFDSAIRAAENIPLLFQHDWNKQLASTSSGTLELREDQIGLRFECRIEDKDVYEKVKSGKVNSCSFGFRALEEKIEPINEKLERRFVSKVELLEVSLVDSPAYVGSLCETRAYEDELEALETKTEEETVEEIPAVEITNEETTEVVDEPREETAEESDEVTSDEDRSFEDAHGMVEEVSVESSNPNEELKELVSSLIEEKLAAVKQAEEQEENLTEYIDEVKAEHQEVERDLERASMRLNADVIKLRLELLKLKNLKDGI